ncbi:MAG: stage III sporulation protein AB [Oscillospiraceae bacterium]|nr:stage III sporulation protein AB [Oscillospiraceae bacterium]
MIAGCLAGHFFAGKLKKRVEQIADLQLFLSEAERRIAFSAPPTDQLIRSLCEDSRFATLLLASEYQKLRQKNLPPGDALAEAVRIQKGISLRPEDLRLFSDAAKQLGTTDLNGQLSLCREYRMRLEENRILAEKERDRSARLYQTLGLLCGAGAGIILV